METTSNAMPKPGSDDAVLMGCTCARMDNSYGKGYLGQPDTFVMTEGCPVHRPKALTDAAMKAAEEGV